MDNFKGEMDSENYETTKNKFEKFQKMKESASSRLDTTRLDTGHPTMADFLKTIYAHCFNAAQVWLYKEQQALRFIDLTPITVISNELQGVPTSSLDYDLLFYLNRKLDTKHRSELNPSTWDSV
ncbi:hypothetical protein HC256_009422 [Beauveria bassiana]|nr:hypothetical protein HC256_009422 [Beauveria bassiana]